MPTDASAAPKSAASPPPKRNNATPKPPPTPKRCANANWNATNTPKTALGVASIEEAVWPYPVRSQLAAHLISNWGPLHEAHPLHQIHRRPHLRLRPRRAHAGPL